MKKMNGAKLGLNLDCGLHHTNAGFWVKNHQTPCKYMYVQYTIDQNLYFSSMLNFRLEENEVAASSLLSCFWIENMELNFANVWKLISVSKNTIFFRM